MQGGMGAVYVVEQLATGRERALKLMHPRLVADPKLRRRFEQEAKVGAQIDSAHVVEVVGAGVDDATSVPWLCMELLRGQDLAAAIAARGTMPPAEVRAIFEQLCHAVGAAHAVGVVHRDLKPENVFLATSRQAGVPFVVKVLDFGIAKVVAEGRTTDTSPIGTPLWMAPEQTSAGVAIGPPTDVWALGLIAFKLLTGRSYWKGAADESSSAIMLLREIVLEPLVPASVRARELGCGGELPPAFDGWFARCVARDAADRFPDATEAFRALAPVLGGSADGFRAPAQAVPAPGDATRDTSLTGLARTFDPRAGTPPVPSGLEATELGPRGQSAGDDLDDDPPASEPRRAPAGKSKGRTAAAVVVGVVAVVAGTAFGVHRILKAAEQTAVNVIASAEASVHQREEEKSLDEKRKALAVHRADLDRVLGRMVAIPAGTFDMGSDDVGNDERPVHKATVAAFEIDAVEVTVASYKRCVGADKCTPPHPGPRCNFDKPDRVGHPVNCVEFPQARAFCHWAGKRLPTEEEWEYAARGTEGRQYPWGNLAPTTELCWRRFDKLKGRSDGTCAVGQSPQGDTPFGLKDLAGNVREWTSSPYCPYTRKDCQSGLRILRGGTWMDDDPLGVRAAIRDRRAPEFQDDYVGFRCARDTL